MSKIDKIVDHKILTKKKLNILRRKYLYIIYFGILNNEEWFKIHDKLVKETIKYKKIDVSKIYAVGEYVFRESQKYRNHSNPSLALFLFLDVAYHLFAKPINNVVNTEENELKSEYLTNMINDARENKQVFYLCSRHNDCAKDHEDWQGKIYIDEHFDFYENSKNVLDFINNNRIPTIQWVIQGPVWMTSRPNCRHFFTPISTQDALKLDNKKLLTKYKMSFSTGYKGVDSKEQAAKEKLKFYEDLFSVSNGSYIKKKIDYYKKYLKKHK